MPIGLDAMVCVLTALLAPGAAVNGREALAPPVVVVAAGRDVVIGPFAVGAVRGVDVVIGAFAVDVVRGVDVVIGPFAVGAVRGVDVVIGAVRDTGADVLGVP